MHIYIEKKTNKKQNTNHLFFFPHPVLLDLFLLRAPTVPLLGPCFQMFPARRTCRVIFSMHREAAAFRRVTSHPLAAGRPGGRAEKQRQIKGKHQQSQGVFVP